MPISLSQDDSYPFSGPSVILHAEWRGLLMILSIVFSTRWSSSRSSSSFDEAVANEAVDAAYRSGLFFFYVSAAAYFCLYTTRGAPTS